MFCAFTDHTTWPNAMLASDLQLIDADNEPRKLHNTSLLHTIKCNLWDMTERWCELWMRCMKNCVQLGKAASHQLCISPVPRWIKLWTQPVGPEKNGDAGGSDTGQYMLMSCRRPYARAGEASKILRRRVSEIFHQLLYRSPLFRELSRLKF